MRSWFLSHEAKATLTDIYTYTVNKWGDNQSDKNLDGLFETSNRMEIDKELWQPIPSEFEIAGYFARYERHYIYWKEFSRDEIGIAAILHASMLPCFRGIGCKRRLI